MGRRTLAFTKQMLRVFHFVELEEPDHLVANSWSSIPRSSEMDRNLFATHNEYKQAQINKYIYIYKEYYTIQIKHNKICKTK
jgi:hypothetical protein